LLKEAFTRKKPSKKADMDSTDCHTAAAAGGAVPLAGGNGHHLSFQVCHIQFRQPLKASAVYILCSQFHIEGQR
jgi:hypothetical protein